MEDQPSFIGVVISWLPMLLLIAVWIFFMTRMGLGKAQKRAWQYQQDHMDELRKQNALLERIAKALEERRST